MLVVLYEKKKVRGSPEIGYIHLLQTMNVSTDFFFFAIHQTVFEIFLLLKSCEPIREQ